MFYAKKYALKNKFDEYLRKKLGGNQNLTKKTSEIPTMVEKH